MTIEDAAELRLQQPHVVRLESRPAGVEGTGEVTIRDLLRNALRMRPDRIVIGEVRGAEALDLLTALNTGHDGALSTVHANSPADALSRLETLALMAGVGLPHAAIAEQVRRGIDLVVHLERRADGARGVTEVAEVAGVSVGGGLLPLAAPRPAASRRWRPRGAAGDPGGGALAGGWRSSPCGGPAARATRRSTLERRRLAVLGAGAAVARRLVPRRRRSLALPLAVAGPAATAWAISTRRRRYRAGGRARAAGGGDGDRRLARAPGARCAPRCRRRPRSLDGPPAAELARLGAELDLGAPTAEAVAAWRRRMRSERVDAFAAALLSQRLAGGDLAGLLRRFAAGAAERDRVAEDARSATAQARFTGLLVVAMPTGGALFAELIQPGLHRQAARLAAAAVMLALAAALQVAGFLAIRRISRVVE